MDALCTTTSVVSKSTLKSKEILISRLLEVRRQEEVEKVEIKKNMPTTFGQSSSHSLFFYDFTSRQKLKPDAELEAAVDPDVARRDGRLVQVDHDLKFVVVGRDPSRTAGGGDYGHSGDRPYTVLFVKIHLIRASLPDVIVQPELIGHRMLKVGGERPVKDIPIPQYLRGSWGGEESRGDEDGFEHFSESVLLNEKI